MRMNIWREGESKASGGRPRPEGLTLQLDLGIGVVQASMVCHHAGSLQVGQHHLHAVLRAAPGLRTFGRGCVTLQQSDERQDMRKCGVAQRRAFCKEGDSRLLETLEGPTAHCGPRNRHRRGKGGACLRSQKTPRAPDSWTDRSFQILSTKSIAPLARPQGPRLDGADSCQVQSECRNSSHRAQSSSHHLPHRKVLLGPERVETCARSHSNMGGGGVPLPSLRLLRNGLSFFS